MSLMHHPHEKPHEKGLLGKIHISKEFSGKSRTHKILVGVGLLAGIGVVLGGILVLAVAATLPSDSEIANLKIPESTKIFDRTGEVLLYDMSENQQRVVVPLSEFPQQLKDATIAIEDPRFYSTPGIDLLGIGRAMIKNILAGEIVEGGSTITQQLAKKVFLTDDRTFTRKAKEALLAIKLSRYYTKDEILELYLNQIPYGPTINGAETAAQMYFNKPVREISLAQAALLAALPQSPVRYSPWGKNTDQLFARQKRVLKAMLDQDKITQEQYDQAVAEEITFKERFNSIKAPHLSLMVQDYVVEKYGEEAVGRGGLRITTTLDWKMQEAAEKAVLEGAKRNESLYGGTNAALMAIDPKTGQVLALAGSRDYFDESIDGNYNVPFQALRQPGSTLKPLVYMAAFMKGYTPSTQVYDVPTEFVSGDPNCPAIPNFASGEGSCFHPQNFDGAFPGPVSLRSALAQSRNVPAVKALYLVGLRDMLGLAEQLGLTTLGSAERLGLSLVLGGGEVHLADLVRAYSVFPGDGSIHDRAVILEIKDEQGEVLEKFEDKVTKVVDPEYPRMINSILTDVNERGRLLGSSLSSTIFDGYDVALKTGTTNDYRDAWAIGYTPSIVVGVWAGNNNNRPMVSQGSSLVAAIPIWSQFLREALPLFPQGEALAKSNGPTTGKPILDGNPMPDGTAHSILHWVDRSNPTGPPPSNPGSDPQYSNWETAVQVWAGNMSSSSTSTTPGSAAISISLREPSGPISGREVEFSGTANLTQEAGDDEIDEVVILWNGSQVRRFRGNFGSSYDFSGSFRNNDGEGSHTFVVLVRTKTGAENSRSIEVTAE